MVGMDLASDVSCRQRYDWDETVWQHPEGYGRQTSAVRHVVVVDYGIKRNILRSLASKGLKLTVMPASTKADDLLALSPDGIFLSNGPGDPAATGRFAVPEIKKLIDSGKPVFGICLGHQMLALALGATTEKMKFGHHGANHPVKDLTTGKVEITSQNHGFSVDMTSLPDHVEPDPCLAVRWLIGRFEAQGSAGFLRSVPSGSGPRPRGQRLSVRSFSPAY